MAVSQKKKPNAVDILTKDHKKVRALLESLNKSRQPSRKKELFKEIAKELEIHTQIEEDIFYPAFKESHKNQKDLKLFFEAKEEHRLVDIVLLEMKTSNVAFDEWSAKAKVLKDLVEHHAQEEEEQMFPRAKSLMSKEELQNLGEQLEEAKKALAEKSPSTRATKADKKGKK